MLQVVEETKIMSHLKINEQLNYIKSFLVSTFKLKD